jgi:hypothetical protein
MLGDIYGKGICDIEDYIVPGSQRMLKVFWAFPGNTLERSQGC